jgi:serine phosphatase RsbU (regulator of sigma subunit)
VTVARDPFNRFDRFAERTRDRFDAFASRFAADARKARARSAPALDADYWKALQDLFTRDVTHEGLSALFRQEAQDTFHFFTREIDLSDVQSRPWHERWPIALWRTFQAVAYRLSPWRRILFALATPILLVGWFRFGVILVLAGPLSLAPLSDWEVWALLGATLLYFLLVLELRDKLGLKGDLEVARQIQFGLLPFEPFAQDGVAIATAMRPANTVGGDYFDVIPLGPIAPKGSGGPKRIAVVVGDVAGKGMPAALLMALLQGSLHTLVNAGLRGAELVGTLNAHLCKSLPSNRLITLFYSELEMPTGALTYVNAGHNPPFLLPAAGPTRRLEPNGMALGLLDDTPFVADATVLVNGDHLFLYTDGLTEAANPADEEFGDDRLRNALESRRGAPGPALIEEVIAEVLRFCGPAKPRDDMTLLSLRREA